MSDHKGNHQRAAELHDKAAHAHIAAAAHWDKQDHQTGQEHSKEAHEHSRQAFLHSREVFGHESIATLAHELWRERGCPHGSPEEDWFQAPRQFSGRRESQR